jgi:DNA polymerase lambda
LFVCSFVCCCCDHSWRTAIFWTRPASQTETTAALKTKNRKRGGGEATPSPSPNMPWLFGPTKRSENDKLQLVAAAAVMGSADDETNTRRSQEGQERCHDSSGGVFCIHQSIWGRRELIEVLLQERLRPTTQKMTSSQQQWNTTKRKRRAAAAAVAAGDEEDEEETRYHHDMTHLLRFISRRHIRVDDSEYRPGLLYVKNCTYSKRYIRVVHRHRHHHRQPQPQRGRRQQQIQQMQQHGHNMTTSMIVPQPGKDSEWLGPVALQHGDVLQFWAEQSATTSTGSSTMPTGNNHNSHHHDPTATVMMEFQYFLVDHEDDGDDDDDTTSQDDVGSSTAVNRPPRQQKPPLGHDHAAVTTTTTTTTTPGGGGGDTSESFETKKTVRQNDSTSSSSSRDNNATLISIMAEVEEENKSVPKKKPRRPTGLVEIAPAISTTPAVPKKTTTTIIDIMEDTATTAKNNIDDDQDPIVAAVATTTSPTTTIARRVRLTVAPEPPRDDETTECFIDDNSQQLRRAESKHGNVMEPTTLDCCSTGAGDDDVLLDDHAAVHCSSNSSSANVTTPAAALASTVNYGGQQQQQPPPPGHCDDDNGSPRKKTKKRVRFAEQDAEQHTATAPGHDDSSRHHKRTAQSAVGAVSTDVAPAAATTTTTTAHSPFIFYFVPKGTDMATSYIEGDGSSKGLRQHVEERGIVTQKTFCQHTPPTHLIISDRLSNDNVVWEYLDFASRDDFIDYITLHNVSCVYRTWATRDDIARTPPTMMDKVLGLVSTRAVTKNPTTTSKTTTALTTTMAAGDSSSTTGRQHHVYNEALSNLFKTLAQWYQECPLLEHDSFRSYTFTVMAGRVRHLPYEITKDRLAQLEQGGTTKGFGTATLQIIREFLLHRTCERLDQLKNDKNRRSMRNMMRIWGVGPAKASELVAQGHSHIGSVRKALHDKYLTLDRNQYIGVLNYEDFQEEMNREEVEAIANVILVAVRSRYPAAEVTIMGSYRRGKNSCGDVDILITHPDYPDRIPPTGLALILDDLRVAGHISYHLTRVYGMKEELFETLPEHVANRMMVPKHRYYNLASTTTTTTTDHHHVASWMGVFQSPLFQLKQRRVDIKWYPHQERVYAALYFTGNGHFNRSMRLWAKRRFSYRLSDHDLFDTVQNRPVLSSPPSSEKEVFQLLRLQWKEPNERDCFDAVEPLDANDIVFGMQMKMSKAEFMADDPVWVQ